MTYKERKEAALGKPGDDYPLTHARYHKNLRIVL